MYVRRDMMFIGYKTALGAISDNSAVNVSMRESGNVESCRG